MARAYKEIVFSVPLASPVETDAYHASSDGEWRLFVFTGTPSNKLIYQRFLRVAPPSLDVVVITRPGFGKGHDRAFTDFDDQVAAIKPFLPGGAFGDKKLIVMGVSYGGELALKAALDFPDAVKGVLTLAALIEEPHEYALTLEKITRDLEAGGGAKWIDAFSPNRWKKVRDEVAGRRDQIGPLLGRLNDYEGPVEVLHGDFDAIVPRSNADRLYECLSEASRGRLDIVPGGTHYLEGQYPRRVHQAVQRVIERAVAKERSVA
ncbi:MAG: alpha/beta hydrolase [Pseudomonadota bacterium]